MKQIVTTCFLYIAVLIAASGCATGGASVPESAPEKSLTGLTEVRLIVYGLSCPLCAHNLDGVLLRMDGVESARIDLETGAVRVALQDGHGVTPSALQRAVEDSGFTLKRIEPVD